MTMPEQIVEPSVALTLVAPVDGVMVALEDLPDPVFADKILGDGISIDPIGSVLVAPCDGEVVLLHRALHALTLRTSSGFLILIHIGLDTVSLNGKGFKALVRQGDQVRCGQRLIEFDLDLIAQHALSALTEMVITEGGGTFLFKRRDGMVLAGKDQVIRLGEKSSQEQTPQAEGDVIETEHLSIVNANGLHARPAARLANEAKRYQSRVFVHKAKQKARATSVTDLMGLDLCRGDQIWLSAQGLDASEALGALKLLIERGLGQEQEPTEARPQAIENRFVSDDPQVVGGVAASPGLAVGRIQRKAFELPPFDAKSARPAEEQQRLRTAIRAVLRELELAKQGFERDSEIEKAQIFTAHAELLQDEAFEQESISAIEQGASAPAAWQSVIDSRVKTLSALSNPLMRQRAVDLKDVGQRVLFKVLAVVPPAQSYTSTTVLASDELTPSDVASLTAGNIGALVTASGSGMSHAAILARSMGVPYVASVAGGMNRLQDGLTVIVDGDQGFLRLQPDEQTLKQARQQIADREAQRRQRLAQAGQRAVTLDSRAIEVAANIGSAKDAIGAVNHGCDGVGLLRSEFLFMNRRQAPSEEEQRQQFELIGKTLGSNRSLVVRTLDVGGDKPLQYMPIAPEDNPFLGIRGLRLSLRYPDLFSAQLRAILAAAKHTRLHVMFPMVAQVAEFRAAKKAVVAAMHQASVDPKNVSLGIMVEVPSAALLADSFAKEVDFFSIGTNDLTQYTLAMDRGHPELAVQADAFDPSILRLIRLTAQAAHAHKKWVGICGGLAAELLAAPLLVGLDIDELSVPIPVIPELKERIRQLNHQQCKQLANEVLDLPDSASVRSQLKAFSNKALSI